MILKRRTAGRELHLVVGGTVERDIHAGQLAHDRRQTFHREGDRAAFLHLGLDFATDAEIEIGGGQRDVVLFRLDQHVAEDGHRRLGADDVQHLGQAVGEMVAVDFEFHGKWDGVRNEARKEANKRQKNRGSIRNYIRITIGCEQGQQPAVSPLKIGQKTL